jgi:3-deoxy-manno-octulosonate cytidylyltransferase (CMP-KDO synthetase)
MTASKRNGAAPFIVVIPARRAATRLPDKPLLDVAGKPLVVRVADQARKSGAERVLIATDDTEIAAACEAHGYSALLTRRDHSSGTDRLAEVAILLDLPDETIVVNVQGDEPLLPPDLIDRCADTLALQTECAVATACHSIANRGDLLNPNVVKVVVNARGHALYFSRAPIPWQRDSTEDPSAALSAARRHIGIYAYRARFLKRYATLDAAPMEKLEKLEQLRALWHGFSIAIFETDEAPPAGVDTPEDLERVRTLFSAGGRDGAVAN